VLIESSFEVFWDFMRRDKFDMLSNYNEDDHEYYLSIHLA